MQETFVHCARVYIKSMSFLCFFIAFIIFSKVWYTDRGWSWWNSTRGAWGGKIRVKVSRERWEIPESEFALKRNKLNLL